MSQSKRQTDVEGGHFGWPQSASKQPSQGESNFGDSSGPLFSIYTKMTEEDDNQMADRWQKDAQIVVIFAGLFSILVAVLSTVSIQYLRPNSQDTSAFYLENIYQVVADLNVPNAPTPSSMAKLPPFSPPKYAVWVNVLWFLSIVISLTAALLAIMLHQWAGRYVRITQPLRRNPHKRARIRAFFADGVEKLHTHWAVEALPILLHLSLFFFLAGLLVFLFNINQTTFGALIVWVTLSTSLYICITLMPIFRYDSPYYAPLSPTAWFLYAGSLYAVFGGLCSILGSRVTPEYLRDLKNRYRGWTFGGVEKAAEHTALDRSLEVDGHILDWTIGALGDDNSLERFIEAIPGFCDSQEVHTPLPFLLQMKIRLAIDGFLTRTFSSQSIPDSVKVARLAICLDAADAALGTFVVSRILGNLLDKRWPEVPRSIEMAQSLRRWCHSGDEWIAFTARTIVAGILVIQERDDRWIALASDQFDLPEHALRTISPSGDSVLLLILLHVARTLLYSNSPPWDSPILHVLSQFNIHNTLPRLQHEFCVLWNEIVREAQNSRPYSPPFFILKEIRHLYAALHEGPHASRTTRPTSPSHGDDHAWQASSYSLCNVYGHVPDSMSHVHEVRTGRSAHASPATIPRRGPVLPPLRRHIRRDAAPFPALNRGPSNQRPVEPPSGDVPDARRRSIPVDTSLNPGTPESAPLPTTSADITYTTRSSTDTSITRRIARPIRRPVPRIGTSPQRSEDTIVVSPPVVSDPMPPPVLMRTLRRAIPVERPSIVETPLTRSDDIPHAPGVSSLSSLSPRNLPHFNHAPEFASDLDPHVTTATCTAGEQYETRDEDSPTSMEVARSIHQSDPAISAETPQPEDPQYDSNQS